MFLCVFELHFDLNWDSAITASMVCIWPQRTPPWLYAVIIYKKDPPGLARCIVLWTNYPAMNLHWRICKITTEVQWRPSKATGRWLLSCSEIWPDRLRVKIVIFNSCTSPQSLHRNFIIFMLSGLTIWNKIVHYCSIHAIILLE